MVVDIRPVTGSSNYTFTNITRARCILHHASPNIWGEDTANKRFLPMVARRLVDVMPRLANIRVRRTWRGCIR